MNDYDYVARGSKRFLQIAPGSVYESQIQAIVERNIQSIFPEYIGHRFEPYFRTSAGDVRPDLVLVRRDASGWALIEVEADTHPWSSHILPQVTKLRYARGDERIVAEFSHRHPNYLSADELTDAISRKPLVFLIVHGSSSEYRNQLNELGVQRIDIDVTYCHPNDYALVVRDQSTSFREIPGSVQRSSDSLTRGIWILKADKTLLPTPIGGRMVVEVDGATALWHVSATSDGYLLRQPGGLEDGPAFDHGRIFVNDEDNSLRIGE